MAGFNINIDSHNTGVVGGASALSRLRLITVAARKKSIIHPMGLVWKGRSTVLGVSSKSYMANSANADIASFKLLSPTTTFNGFTTHSGNAPDAGPYPEVVTLESFATNSGVMQNLVSDGTTATAFDVIAYKDAGGNMHDVTIRIEAYKRDATTGAETLLDSDETGLITTSVATYSVNLNINAKWTGDDRFYVKYSGINYGVPAPP